MDTATAIKVNVQQDTGVCDDDMCLITVPSRVTLAANRIWGVSSSVGDFHQRAPTRMVSVRDRIGSWPIANPFGDRVLLALSVLPVRCWRVAPDDRFYHNRLLEDDNVYFVHHQPRKMTWGIPMKKGRGQPVQTKLNVEEGLGDFFRKHYENQPLTWPDYVLTGNGLNRNGDIIEKIEQITKELRQIRHEHRDVQLHNWFARQGALSGSCVGVGANPQNVRREAVNHPDHYNANPSGVEAIDVIEHMTFNVGNAVKYLWRADHKGKQIEDLKKARWYVDREIQRLSSLTDDNKGKKA